MDKEQFELLKFYILDGINETRIDLHHAGDRLDFDPLSSQQRKEEELSFSRAIIRLEIYKEFERILSEMGLLDE